MPNRAALPVLLFSALLAACGDAPAALRVGELRFTAEEVSHLDSAQLETLADLAALSEAIREGRVPDLVAQIAEHEARRARLRWLPAALAAHRLGDEELASRYSAEPMRELRVRHVLRLAERGAPPEQHAEARRVAEEVRSRAAAGEPFEALAAAYSEEPGADRRGGLLDWGGEDGWVEPFWNAAAALSRGEVSPVVQTVYGYHVILLDNERPIPARLVPRGTLLRRTVGPAEADRAFSDWVAGLNVELTPDAPAIRRAHQALRGEGEAPDSLVLASWLAGAYTLRDLRKDAALLEPRERQRVLELDDRAFGEMVLDDARGLMWLARAREEEVLVTVDDPRQAVGRWVRSVEGWGAALGLGQRDPAAASAASLRALAATGQEERIARSRLAGIRFRLRELYSPEPRMSESG